MAAWNAATWMAGAVYGLLVSAVLVRSIGWEGFGIWATIASVRSFLVFLDGGLAIGVARDAALAGAGDGAAGARLRASYRIYALLALIAVLVSGLGAGLVGMLFGLSGDVLASTSLVTRLVGLEAAIALAAGVLPAILRGRQRFDALGIITICQTLLGLAILPFMLERWGLVGAAAAALVARLVVTSLGFLWMRRAGLLHFEEGETKSETLPMAGLLRFATPLWIAAIGAQLGLMTDVPIVAGFYGEADSGAFAVGARLPAAGAALLFAILASSFPRLVTATAAKRRSMGSALLCMGCILAGAGFGYIALHAETLLDLIFRDAPLLAVQVLWIYSLAWCCNAPAHVLSSMAIALGRHRVIAKVVLVEAISNLALSLALAFWVSAQGPALATLITLFVSNILILPPLLRRRLEMSWSSLIRPVAFGLFFGAVASLSAAGFASLVTDESTSKAILALLLTLAFAGAFLDLTSRGSSSLRRIILITYRRGWPVLRRQARQVASERTRLQALRNSKKTTSPSDSQALVTVRIATYNRGPLVAERAIASALRQSHENLEILVVGDCCDAATADAVLAVKDPRVRFVNLPERGKYPENPMHRWMVAGAAPMNHALEIMRGDWIAPLDDDDEFSEDHVEVLLAACQERNLEFAYGVAEMEADDGSWSSCGAWPLAHGHIVHGAVLYSARLRNFLHDPDCWRVDEPGDWNLWRRFQRAGIPMGFVDKVVARHYRERREVKERAPFWLGDGGQNSNELLLPEQQEELRPAATSHSSAT